MKAHKRKISRKDAISDRKINKKNKSLMIDKILSYSPGLIEGIEVYKDAYRNFLLLISLGALLINFPLISVPCCILSVFFIIRMFQYIRYKSINKIVNTLANDISFKGIFDRQKVNDLLEDFRLKYGSEIYEYNELTHMIEKYEIFVTKIEFVLKNISIKEKDNVYSKDIINNKGISYIKRDKKFNNNEIKENKYKNKEFTSDFKIYDDSFSVLYKKEDGEIKKINKAIEFFENENSESHKKDNAVILNNVSNENKNLTVYLYKKSSTLQKNAL